MKTGAAAVTLRNQDDDLKTLVERSHKNSRKRSPSDEYSDVEKGEACAAQKKKKLSWTESLHNRFLEAIRIIGFDRAVPKKILEVMNVPGLTRDNVSSHLQKYRNFLKRARVDDTQSSSRHSFSTSSSPKPTSLLLNQFSYQQYSTALSNNLRNQSGVFGQPRSMLADKGIPAPGLINPSYNNSIMTTPSNYEGYDISNLRNLTENSNVVDSFGRLSNDIGDYAQLYLNLPNTGNIHPMIHDLEALSDQQPLDQGDHLDSTFGNQVMNILNQAPAQRNEGKTLATTSNFYGNTSQWGPSCVSSFDPAPKQQHCNQNLLKPQEFASSSGQLINSTIHLQPVHEHDEDGELETLLANIWSDSDVGI